MLTDKTHDAARKSWVESANDNACDFPIQNLPFGVFSHGGEDQRRIGVAIGDHVLDLRRLIESERLPGIEPTTACALCADALNDFLRLGRQAWSEARAAIADVLDADCGDVRDNDALRQHVLVGQGDVQMHLPARIGDYTDFYASIHHATNIGSMFRPDNPLLPNYRHVPIGYHGRASSFVISGTEFHRPMGQTKADDADAPSFTPSRLLDYEMEMGVFVGPGNAMGDRIPIEQAGDHLFGMVIVNDWSARDIQKWEYQPLGPFNSKNFATTISPWVVTMEALAPFRIAGPYRTAQDPKPLNYLLAEDDPSNDYGLNIAVEVAIASERMRRDGMKPVRISRGNFRQMYWTIAQMLTHHASGGCNMTPGDLLASGTISNEAEDTRGCLLERTWRGQNPIDLPDGTQRKFLQDGDEVIMSARCEDRDSGATPIGFGQCRGIVLPVS